MRCSCEGRGRRRVHERLRLLCTARLLQSRLRPILLKENDTVICTYVRIYVYMYVYIYTYVYTYVTLTIGLIFVVCIVWIREGVSKRRKKKTGHRNGKSRRNMCDQTTAYVLLNSMYMFSDLKRALSTA